MYVLKKPVRSLKDSPKNKPVSINKTYIRYHNFLRAFALQLWEIISPLSIPVYAAHIPLQKYHSATKVNKRVIATDTASVISNFLLLPSEFFIDI